ncbi:MAG: hypothetical protein L3J39_12790 [Verrucomicrobiales bacterium]|nr:hypothetical protein [Verrucomicrobiales bacterium]
MKQQQDRFEVLLAQLLDAEADAGARDELASLCAGDADRCAKVREQLRFAQWLRQACGGDQPSFAQAVETRIELAADELDELTAELLFGEGKSLSPQDEQDFSKNELGVQRLREELQFDEWLSQAACKDKSEEAFVQSLSTRMWAEEEEDHFVTDLAAKIIAFDDQPVATTNRILSISLADRDGTEKTNGVKRSARWNWVKPTLAAAAAVMLAGVLLWNLLPAGEVGTVVAQSGEVIWDEISGKAPAVNGGMSKGVYRLQSGTVYLRFAEGVEMAVEGPAEFEIKSKREVQVGSGLVVTRALTNERSDFRIAAKGINLLVDGATMGLDMRDVDGPELAVLSGKTELELTAAKHLQSGELGLGKKRNLYHFEAVRADFARDKWVDIPFNSRPFSKAWELMAGVAANTGTVEVAVPGRMNKSLAEGSRVRVTMERDQFELNEGEALEVDTLSRGRFVSMNNKKAGEMLSEKGKLRSYLLEFKPGKDGKLESTLEASMTFDHPVVGVIFSEDRLVNSEQLLGGAREQVVGSMGQGQLLLSDDGRTVNLLLSSVEGRPVSGTVRVLVALN